MAKKICNVCRKPFKAYGGQSTCLPCLVSFGESCFNCIFEMNPLDCPPCSHCMGTRDEKGFYYYPHFKRKDTPQGEAQVEAQVEDCEDCFYSDVKAKDQPCASCGYEMFNFRPQDTPQGGIKTDSGKVQMSLLPWDSIEACADLMTKALAKYPDPENWKKVPDAQRRYRDAILRHMTAIIKGEKIDSEYGLPHSVHLAVNALFLVHFDLAEKMKSDFFKNLPSGTNTPEAKS